MRKEEKNKTTKERKSLPLLCLKFATKGYQGFVINELCKVDGISKGVLYHNFSGKSDLYLTCVRRVLRKLWQCFWGVEGQVPSLADYMERRHKIFISNTGT